MLKKLCLSIILLLAPMLAIYQAPALADDCASASCKAIEGGVTDADGGTAPTSSLDDTVKTAINLLSIAAGVAATAMIILSGLAYITSGGNAEKIKTAKNRLLYVVVGLVIVALAQTISHFVLSEASNPSTVPPSPPSSQAPDKRLNTFA